MAATAGRRWWHGRTLTNPIWIYGDDDDTLFRQIALGTGKSVPAMRLES